MTSPKNPHDQGAKVSAAIAIRTEHRNTMAEKRAREISEAGTFLPSVTDEQWNDILDRIGSGEISSHVMKDFGLSPSTITAKARRDPAFRERYKDALEDHYVALAEDIRMVTRGVEGYSTGDPRRDELVAKYDLALARQFANRVLGERIAVDQRTVTINMNKGEQDW